MIKGKKYIAALLTIASITSFTGIGLSTPAYAAELSNYSTLNDYKTYEGKDSNGLTWEYVKNNDGTITLDGTSDLTSTVQIPSKIDGNKVTGIRSVVRFYQLTNIHGKDYDRAVKDGNVVTKVILPDSLEYLGDAFECCKNLTSVDVPKSVKYFNLYSWSQKWIQNYKNSDGLIIINNILVNGSEAEGKIKIPDNVTEIADDAFYINYSGNSKITKVSIPSSVKRIGKNAFCDCTNLEKVTIGDGIKEIDEHAFEGCTDLSDLDIPDDVDNISSSAFDGCTSLDNKPNYSSDGLLIVDDGLLYSGEDAKGDVVVPDYVQAIGDEAFSGNDKITSIKIPGNVEKIGSRAFEGCSNLKTVILEDGVKSVENEAFKDSGVKSVSVPDSIESFGKDVFLGCTSLEDATNRSNGLIVTKDGVLCSGYTAKGEVSVPDDVKEIQSYAFFGNDKITSVAITGNTEKIDSQAFQDCSNLSKLYLGNGVKEIGGTAFFNCSKLKKVILPDSLEKLGYYAFGSCSSLTSVSYKDGLSIDNSFANTPWNENKVNSGETNPDNQSGQVSGNKPTGTVSDWQCIDGKWYYINADGSKQTGWFFDIRYGKWYYLGTDGVRQIGWIYYAPYNSWFYLDPYDGARISGWLYDPNYGSWFFLNDNGTMKTGWMYDYSYGQWYYLNGNGTMRTGWFYDNNDGNWYYLYSNGAMARSTYVGGYYVNGSGAWVY
ncbi:MAG: leucine-rich repeat protein [Clostridium sp.]|nr:leucine-rich repeat protein [Clostridium sp.]